MACSDNEMAEKYGLTISNETRKNLKQLANSGFDHFEQIKVQSDKPEDWFLYDTCIHLYFDRLL